MKAIVSYTLALWLWITPCLAQDHERFLYEAQFQDLLQSGELDVHLDDNGASSFNPWDHEPTCTRQLEALGSKLCVYTSKRFGNGRGISLFTTPQVASFVATLAPFQDFDFFSSNGMNGFIDAWYTEATPDKGTGMFAKRNLSRGDTITAYTPVLLAFQENILPKHEREKFLRMAVERLPPHTKEAYYQLSRISDDQAIVTQDIVSANSFEMVLDGSPHLAVIPEPSRINHACMPNAQFHTRPEYLTHWIQAVRPINRSEEITIAYSSPLAPYADRQQYLRNGFGFTCTCPRCERGGTADRALTEINTLENVLSDWEPSSTASTKQAEQLLRIYINEGLDGYMDPAYCHAALTYNAAGSVRGAEKYIKLAEETQRLRLGPGVSDLGACNGMKDNLQNHWSWRRRKDH
jgi:hypothetical protein